MASKRIPGKMLLGLPAFEYAESLGDSVHSLGSGVWENKLTLTTAVLETGAEYRIGVTYNWQYSSKVRDFRGRLMVDGVQDFFHQQQPATSTSQRQWVGSFVYFTGAGSSIDIDLEFTRQSGGDTATIAGAKIEMWRVA